MFVRPIIVTLVASGLFLLSSSLAQLEWIDVGEDIVSNISDTGTSIWQIMTWLDTWWFTALWLDSLMFGPLLLSGENDALSGWWISTGTINSWQNLPIISDPIPRLILSEIYYDGTDEWIEITNIGQWDFQGNITLVGVKSTSLLLTNISLLSGESKVFGDNLSQISETLGKTWLAFNILDTTAINIQLFISGQREDSFLVDQYWVNLYNDKKTSFEKVAEISTRVQWDRIAYAQSGYTINPGMYFATGNVTNVSFPPTQSWINSQLPIACDTIDQSDIIKISEVFPGNEKYPPYIELAVHQDISVNSLSISGDRLGTGVEFSFNSQGSSLDKNSFLLVSSTGFWQNEEIASVRNSGFSLLDTWNYLLITIGSWQSRRVMDIVYLSGHIVGKSSYFGSRNSQCVRIMDVLDEFSPGFDQKFLKYFSGTTTTKIEYIALATGNQTATGTCLLSWQNDVFSWKTIVTTDVSWIESRYTIRIVNVDYDPEGSDTNNEKITLLATNVSGDTTPLDLSKLFRLKVNGTNKTLPRVLPINVPTTFTKTFGFPNSTDNGQSVIVQLTYGDYIFDTYTYTPTPPPLQEEEIMTWNLKLSWTLLDLSGLQFTITYVLPNPIWSDKAEELWLLITNCIDSGCNLLMPEWGTYSGGLDLSQGFSLKIGKSTKKISGIVNIGQENILSGSLWLVNKSSCISLLYMGQELSIFCYASPKEGQKIFASDQWLQETTQENLDILNTLSLKKIGNQLCVWYKEQSFLCKRIPASKAEIKTTQEQKLYKGFASLVKQYIINNWKGLYYNTPIKQYFDRVAVDKKLIAQWLTKVDIYGQTVLITDVKQQLKIIQTTLPWIVALFEWMNWL